MSTINTGVIEWLESEGLNGSDLIIGADRIRAILTYRASLRAQEALFSWVLRHLEWPSAVQLYRRVEFMDRHGGSLVFSASGVTLDDVPEVLFLIDQPGMAHE